MDGKGGAHAQKGEVGVWVGTLIFNLDRSCVCSFLILTLKDKTFLNFVYILHIKARSMVAHFGLQKS